MCPAVLDDPVYINIWEPHYYTLIDYRMGRQLAETLFEDKALQ